MIQFLIETTENLPIIGRPIQLVKRLISIDRHNILHSLREIQNFDQLFRIVKNKVGDLFLLFQIHQYVPEVPEMKIQGKYIVQCPICLSDVDNGVTAHPCKHQFCGNCIMDYWASKLRTKLKCPSCRTGIKQFFRNYNIDFASSQPIKMMSKQVLAYTMRYGHVGTEFLMNVFDLPIHYRSLKNILAQIYDVYKFVKSLFLVIWLSILIIYIISPVDILPELYLGLVGLIDDLVAMIIVVLIVGRSSLFQ